MSMRNPILAATVGVSVLVLVSASGALGQQTSGQQKCLNAINKDGAAVAKTQGKETIGCHKAKGTGKLVGSAQICLSADAKGKVLKAKSKTTADETKNCGTAPGFGYTSAATINGAAVQGELDLEQDIFGADLDAATLDCTAPATKAGCQCQQKVLKDVEKLVDTKLAEFVNCKKAALKAGATSAQALRDCVDNASTAGSIAADTKGKIAKAVTKVGATITKSCPVTVGIFPGDCSAVTGAALATCLDVQVECRVCTIINEMDGIFVNCDLFDNGLADASCVSGTGPTPTPSLTPTPTPTATATPQPGFKGALPATNGRFNYNLTLGLPGANSACNTNFPGTHVCTYLELQSAETAGDLVGAQDTTAALVTSFWAVDSSQPALQQCKDDALGGSNLNWEYGTAHTVSRGQKVALTNPTGALGPLQSSVQCNISGASWVGCCL
jgi:hypothetical protein